MSYNRPTAQAYSTMGQPDSRNKVYSSPNLSCFHFYFLIQYGQKHVISEVLYMKFSHTSDIQDLIKERIYDFPHVSISIHNSVIA